MSVIVLLVFAPVISAQQVTTGSLIKEMTDLERLTKFPQYSYDNIQFSSYDRRSDQPDGKGWYMNSDGFGGEPIPNFQKVLKKPGDDNVGTYLICDVEGPGAMVRGWTARIGGTIRVYLDGAQQPIYEGPTAKFLRNTYDPFLDKADFDPSILNGTFFQRTAGYYPIPFSERLRIEWTGNIQKLHFYEIQVKKYEKGTPVKTFKPSDLKTYSQEIKHSAEVLDNPSKVASVKDSRGLQSFSTSIANGAKKEIVKLEEQGAVNRLAIRLKADDLEKALRQTVLHIKFDGAPKGQVQAPVGDFFGAAPGVNPFTSLPFTVHEDGTMISRFVMPFQESMQLIVENKGEQDVEVSGSVRHKDYSWDSNRSMYFRARWRVDHNMNTDSPYDLPFVAANGKGVYVGTSSMLFNPIEIPTSGGNWWGEGDEKIFVDGHSFPTIFGTGSEDYYNYSWSASDVFAFPYAAQPRNDGPGNRGFVTNHRWHILDPIPFHEQLQFFMEFYPHTQKEGFSYARMSYLYARPGYKDDHMPISKEDVRFVEYNSWSPRSQRAARNSVFYQTEDLVKDMQNAKMLKSNLWAGGELFTWYPEKKDEVLEIPFEIDEKGEYTVWITAAKMENAGKISVKVDGQDVGFGGNDGIIDLALSSRKALRNYESNRLTLDQGKHTITITNEGPSSAREAIGIDFVWMQKQ